MPVSIRHIIYNCTIKYGVVYMFFFYPEIIESFKRSRYEGFPSFNINPMFLCIKFYSVWPFQPCQKSFL